MNKTFSAWRAGAVFYSPVLATGMVWVAAALLRQRTLGALPGCAVVLLGLAILCFFRDPRRTIDGDERAAVSPADGTVVGIEDLEQTPHYAGHCRRIAIFLSVLDVHVNRSPCDGTVRDIVYEKGRHGTAMSAASSNRNEAKALWLDTRYGPVTVRQITGAVARRIVCRASEGDTLAKGEKFGMIKFGSRVEVYLPQTAAAMVKPGDKPRAGLTVLARFQ